MQYNCFFDDRIIDIVEPDAHASWTSGFLFRGTAHVVKEGIYRVVFGGFANEAQSIFVLRNGRAVGLGFHGAEHEGTYSYDPVRNLAQFDIVTTFPGDIELVTGYKIPENGATLSVKLEAPLATPTSRFSLVVADRPIDVAMTYIRPLP